MFKIKWRNLIYLYIHSKTHTQGDREHGQARDLGLHAVGSGGSSSRAVGFRVGGVRFEFQSMSSQFLIAPLALNGQLGLLRPRESKGKLPHNAICQKQPGSNSWFADAWTKRGTHFTLYIQHGVPINI
ncbi:hypothetical protein PoB_006984900 [Plakobranchus ocellatus]|uniref:Uncharacterized protein n=1 Tax=Plakobranchus ocellatus TaxID=259542 RepID=A0AAV4DGQ9_9GAST|nr:hypothetical protein PoB_006984900 [Plakobranchus ocellatus]